MREDDAPDQLNKRKDPCENAIACSGPLDEKRLPYERHAKRCAIVRNQIVCGEGFHASSKSRLHTHCPMDNEPRNRSTSPRCPALGSAHRAKGLPQAIVSPWQVRNLISEKQ